MNIDDILKDIDNQRLNTEKQTRDTDEVRLFRIMPADDFIAGICNKEWKMNSLRRWRMNPRNGEMKMHRAKLSFKGINENSVDFAAWIDTDKNYFFTFCSRGEPTKKHWKNFGDKNAVLIRTSVGKLRKFIMHFYLSIHKVCFSDLLKSKDVIGVEKVEYFEERYLKKWKKRQIAKPYEEGILPEPLMDILYLPRIFRYQKEYRAYLFIDDGSPLVKSENVICRVKRKMKLKKSYYIVLPINDITELIDKVEIKAESEKMLTKISNKLIDIGVPESMIAPYVP